MEPTIQARGGGPGGQFRRSRERDAAAPFRLGDWQVEPARNRLRHTDGQADTDKHLEPRVMDLLVVLAEHRQQPVSKSDLLDRVWRTQFVVEGVLKRGISELRKALGDDARAPRYIETIPKRGYRLILPVQPVSEEPSAPASHIDGSPFRGLEKFELQHAAMFFGRETATQRVLKALFAQAEVGRAYALILGSSGSGKSSLARAGVLPALIAGDGQWRHAVYQRSESARAPLDGLVTALALAVGAPRAEDLIATAREDPEALIHWLQEHLDGGRLALLIDQFEEVFDTRVTAEQRADFIDLVHALARSGHVWIVATLRSDFYPDYIEHAALLSLREPAGLVELRAPGAGELARIIEAPAALAGLEFETDPGRGNLRDTLLEAAVDRADVLPLLEFVLAELYARRTPEGLLTHQAYQDLGGLEGCIANRAEEVFLQLPQQARDALPTIIWGLVSIDGDDRRAALRGATPAEHEWPPAATELIDAFVEARLFTISLDAQSGQRVIAMTHEALLAHWPRVRDWLGANQDALRARSRLKQLTERWESEDRADDYLVPEGRQMDQAVSLATSGVELTPAEQDLVAGSRRQMARRTRIRRGMVSALVVLAVVASGVAMWAVQQRHAAEAETAKTRLLADFLVGLFESSDPGATGGSESARALLDRGATRIEDHLGAEAEQAGSLMHAMSRAYRGMGLYDQAEKWARNALANQTAAGHRVTIAAAERTLGGVLLDQGKPAEARALLDRALDEARGQDPALTAALLNDLGMVEFDLSDLEAASSRLTEALRMREALFGPDHALVADTLNNLGAVQYRRADFDDARQTYLRAIAIYRHQGPATQRELANALNNLASLHHDHHEYAEARNAYDEALDLWNQLYPAGHPQTAAILSNLGALAVDLGEPSIARARYGEAHAMAQRHFGADHPNTAMIGTNLAGMLMEDDPATALSLVNQVDTALATALGETHWAVVRARGVRGQALSRLGRYDEAEPLLLASLAASVGDARATALERIIEHYDAMGDANAVARYRDELNKIQPE